MAVQGSIPSRVRDFSYKKKKHQEYLNEPLAHSMTENIFYRVCESSHADLFTVEVTVDECTALRRQGGGRAADDVIDVTYSS
jgi:hypothetical protein